LTTSTGSGSQRGEELARDDWAPFFEEINRSLMGDAELWATVMLERDGLGGTEAERLPLNSITYEDGDDAIAVGLGGRGQRFPAVLWHFVERPRRVWVREDGGRPAAVTSLSEDGTLTLVRLYGEEGR
jgi:uncharacterized protein DUF5335